MRSCPVCSSNSKHTLMTIDLKLPDQWSYLPSQFTVTTCRDCGMVYHDSPAIQLDLDQYYLSKYYSSTDIGFQQNPSRLNDVADYIANHVPHTSSILEIGCADGKLIKLLTERGFASVGIDIGDEFPDQSFDLIIINHVLEHVIDAGDFLYDIESYLEPDGQFYIEVPDATQYYNHIEKPISFLNFEHLNHFSITTLNHLMGRLGFHATTTFRKTIDISDSWEYPALGGLYQRGTGIWGYDGLLAGNVIKYMTQSYDLELKENERLRTRLDHPQPVAIRGIGHHAFRRLTSTIFFTYNVVAYLDIAERKQLLSFDGYEVISPDDFDGSIPIIALAGSNYVNRLIGDDCRSRGQEVIEL